LSFKFDIFGRNKTRQTFVYDTKFGCMCESLFRLYISYGHFKRPTSIMKYTLILFGLTVLIGACSTTKHSDYTMSYLDSRLESKNLVDSLSQIGIDTILLYHKKHGYHREYFVFWVDKSELQLRNINSTGILEIADWNRNGFYRDKRIFDFYLKHKNTIDTDKLEEDNIKVIGTDTFKTYISHYPYVDINITIGKDIKTYHLPNGVNSNLDNTAFHFARLIESTIYNLEQTTYWKQAEKKFKYYPKKYDPTKEKWQNWRQEKIRNGEIWDDNYH
jgi:hypothetical protein